MPKNVNVMCEVSDKLYESIIAPRKRSKSFTPFIVSLLNAYYENSYVRECVDGVIEEKHEESNSALDDIINQMNANLFNLDSMAKDLKNTSETGYNSFMSGDFSTSDGESKRYTEKPELGKRVGGSGSSEVNSEEFNELKGMVQSVREQNQEIMAMLNRVLSTGTAHSMPVNIDNSEVFGEGEVTSVDESVESIDMEVSVGADDILASLIDGMVMESNFTMNASESEGITASSKPEILGEEADSVSAEVPEVSKEEESKSDEHDVDANDILASLMEGLSYVG